MIFINLKIYYFSTRLNETTLGLDIGCACGGLDCLNERFGVKLYRYRDKH